MGDDWVLKAHWIEADIRVEEPPNGTNFANAAKRKRPAVMVQQLVVPNNGITAIIGESGSGKSSLLAILTGLKPAIELVGKDRPAGERSELLFRAAAGGPARNLLRRQPLPGDIGFVFQDAHLLKSISAKRNAALGAAIAPAAPTSHVFQNWANTLELKKTGAEPLETYSGGQQQRVSIMRALGMDPALLVCDEPTSSLDDETADTVMREIFRWASRPGRAVLWVTHKREQAARYAHRIIGVHEGQVRVLPSGWPIDQSPARDDDTKCLLNMVQIDAVVRASCEGGIQVLDRPQMEQLAATPSRATSQTSTAEAACLDGTLEPQGEVRQRPHWLLYWLWRRAAWTRAIWFAFTSSMAIAFADYRRARATHTHWLARSWPIALLDAARRLALRSLTLVLLLGMTVFYGVYMAYTAFDRHFERRLASPETAHFVLTARHVDKLAVPRLPVLDKSLALPDEAAQSLSKTHTIAQHLRTMISGFLPPPLPMREPRHYGRRTTNMSPVWRADGTSCEQPQSGTFGPGMLVFNGREPLFADLEIIRRNNIAPHRVKAVAAKDMAGGVIITRAVFNYLGVAEVDEDKIEGFCAAFDFGAPSYLRIVGIARSLPGGGDRQYGMAVEEATYRKIFSDAKPENYKDANGRLLLPAYQQAAGYFDYRDRERVFCAYLGCNPGQEDSVKTCQAQGVDGPPAGASQNPDLGGYRVDCDSLAQISSLVETAGSAKLMFLALALAFLSAMVLSTAFAAAAMVDENAKPIAVMRAFGYSLSHVFVLLFGQLVVMLFVAVDLFYVLVAIFDTGYAPGLASSLGVQLADISIRPDALLVSVGGGAVTVAVVALLVLLRWWVSHRHVGPVLQAL